jgi:hypothetical protein
MASYMIGYDLHEGEDYKDLIDTIKRISNGWWHRLDSTWIIKYEGPAGEIRDELKPHLRNPGREGGDRLLVACLTGEAAWTLSFPEPGRQWLKKNL